MSVLTETPAHTHLTRATPGCFCPHCQQLRTNLKTRDYRRAVLQAAGQWRVDAAPARAHVERIRAQTGLGLATIGHLSGAGASAVHVLIRGRMYLGDPAPNTIAAWRAQKLLAFWPNLDHIPAHVDVDATGTHRRLQALAANGWSMRTLAPHTDMCHQELSKILHRRLVNAATARKIRALFRELWDQPAPANTLGERLSSGRIRARAARQGWVRGAAWDDIDDPKCKPKGLLTGEPRPLVRCRECPRSLRLLRSGHMPAHSQDPARRAGDQTCPASGTTPSDHQDAP